MRRAIAPFILLVLISAGCETEKDPVYKPLDPSLHLTDGFCLLKNSRVVLNHYDIDYYDYSAHLIYLNDPGAFEEKFIGPGIGSVCADSTWVYDLSYVTYAASYFPKGPVIWWPFFYYPDDIICIDQAWPTVSEIAGGDDPREDLRIVEALKKYGQFRHGIQFEMVSVQVNSPEDVVLELDLWNEDDVNYYYWDPGKIGMGPYHYRTFGLSLHDTVDGTRYKHGVNPVPPDSWEPMDLDYMSLLKSDSSVRLTITYDRFDTVPPGNYVAIFDFPAPTFVAAREDLDQADGQIWLGEQSLAREVVVQ